MKQKSYNLRNKYVFFQNLGGVIQLAGHGGEVRELSATESRGRQHHGHVYGDTVFGHTLLCQQRCFKR